MSNLPKYIMSFDFHLYLLRWFGNKWMQCVSWEFRSILERANQIDLITDIVKNSILMECAVIAAANSRLSFFEAVIQREYACPENELQNENENNKPDNKQVIGGKYCCLGIVLYENIGASETAFLPHNSYDKITRKHKLSDSFQFTWSSVRGRGDDDFSRESLSSHRNLLIPGNFLLLWLWHVEWLSLTACSEPGRAVLGAVCWWIVLLQCRVGASHPAGGNVPGPAAPGGAPARSRCVLTGGKHGFNKGPAWCHQTGGKGNN